MVIVERSDDIVLMDIELYDYTFQLVQQSLNEGLTNTAVITLTNDYEVANSATSEEIPQDNVLLGSGGTINQDMDHSMIHPEVPHDTLKTKMVSAGTQLSSRPFHYRSKSTYKNHTFIQIS